MKIGIYVYRFLDENDDIIYVGKTNNPAGNFYQNKNLTDEVEKIEILNCLDKKAEWIDYRLIKHTYDESKYVNPDLQHKFKYYKDLDNEKTGYIVKLIILSSKLKDLQGNCNLYYTSGGYYFDPETHLLSHYYTDNLNNAVVYSTKEEAAKVADILNCNMITFGSESTNWYIRNEIFPITKKDNIIQNTDPDNSNIEKIIKRINKVLFPLKY